MLPIRKTDETSLIAATFTPMLPGGHLDLGKIPGMVNRLIQEGITGLFACGGTGEGNSLTSAERKATAEAHVKAAAGRVPVIIQVGHNCLLEARDLAAHAAAIGADGIAAISPTYNKPESPEALVDCLELIASGAPELPFLYYHFPQRTGLNLDIPTFLQYSVSRLPSLQGVKFSDTRLFDLQACREVANGRYLIFYGVDEMLLSGLAAGACGGIGSTFNFAAPLFKRIITAFDQNDDVTAMQAQALAAKMIRVILSYGGLSAQKAVMEFINADCGPIRLPNVSLSANAVNEMRYELEAIGFFDWARPKEK